MEKFKNVLMFLYDEGEMTMESLSIDDSVDDIFDSTEQVDVSDKKEEADVEIDPNDIFKDDDTQESVGEENNSNEAEHSESETDKGSSPKAQFYSSALKALKDDGVLPDIDDDFIKNANDPEKFAEAIEKQVAARLDESQKKIKEALDSNVPVDEVRKFENAINYLNDISEDQIEDESDSGEAIRKRIIYQDYINKGFKPERAQKEVEKSFNAGTDIEDAKIALDSNKEFFQEEYDRVILEQKEKEKQFKIKQQNQIADFKKKVLETEEPLGIKIDKSVRQKILDNIIKPTYKDDSGKLLTGLQKYSKENPNDAEYYFSLFYTMTDGFKNIDKFVGQKVKQNTKNALKDLEHKMKNTPLNDDGTVDFGFSNESEAFKGLKFI